MVSKSQRMQPSSSKDKVPNYKNKEKSRSKIIDNLQNIIFFDNPQSVWYEYLTFTFYKDN